MNVYRVRWINISGQGIPDQIELFPNEDSALSALTLTNGISANWHGILE